MNNCYTGTNVPNLNEEPCGGNYLEDNCIIHPGNIPYLGLPANSSINTVVNNIVLSLIDKDTKIENIKSSITIPTPIVYSSKGTNFTHSYGELLPDAITDSWSEDLLKLTYHSSDLEFLNYNPKFFAFIYKGNVSKKANTSHPNLHKNKRTHKSYVHPPSFSVDWNGESITSLATYKNYSNVSNDNITETLRDYESPFNSFISEWEVPTKTGQETILTGFNPLRWYGFTNLAKEESFGKGKEFFPLSINDKLIVSVTTGRNYLKFPNNNESVILSPRLNLFVKFAIVIENPNKPGDFIVGDMSDVVKISPQSGYFDDGEGANKYFYTWKVKPR